MKFEGFTTSIVNAQFVESVLERLRETFPDLQHRYDIERGWLEVDTANIDLVTSVINALQGRQLSWFGKIV